MPKKPFWDTVRANLVGTIIGTLTGLLISIPGNYLGVKMAINEHEIKLQNCQAAEARIDKELSQLRSEFNFHLNMSANRGGYLK